VKKEKDRLGGLFGAESLGTVRCVGGGGGLGREACGRGVRVWMEGKYTHETYTHKLSLFLSLFLSLSLSLSLSHPHRAHTQTGDGGSRKQDGGTCGGTCQPQPEPRIRPGMDNLYLSLLGRCGRRRHRPLLLQFKTRRYCRGIKKNSSGKKIETVQRRKKRLKRNSSANRS